MPTLDKTIARLNQVLATCHLGQGTFEYCATKASTEELRSLFSDLAVKLSLIGDQLQRQITRYGGRPVQHASATDMLYCARQRLKLLLERDDDRALLSEGLQLLNSVGEDIETLVQEELPPLFRDPLVDQYNTLLQRQVHLRALLENAPDNPRSEH
ncbi:DUF2383 domain-containing protein [Pseudomonas sp. EA_35y_Pfl2_R111]|uniref:DUF2383 domain-containing protein n=1 Tax=Pseudomonas sp. EA_35y_Pfl2_R111 TaxID=3088689 RepID=UPI0030DA520F